MRRNITTAACPGNVALILVVADVTAKAADAMALKRAQYLLTFEHIRSHISTRCFVVRPL